MRSSDDRVSAASSSGLQGGWENYYEERPHSALKNLNPRAFANQIGKPEKSCSTRTRVRGKISVWEIHAGRGPVWRVKTTTDRAHDIKQLGLQQFASVQQRSDFLRRQPLLCTGRYHPTRSSCATPRASLRFVLTSMAESAALTWQVSKRTTSYPPKVRPACSHGSGQVTLSGYSYWLCPPCD